MSHGSGCPSPTTSYEIWEPRSHGISAPEEWAVSEVARPSPSRSSVQFLPLALLYSGEVAPAGGLPTTESAHPRSTLPTAALPLCLLPPLQTHPDTTPPLRQPLRSPGKCGLRLGLRGSRSDTASQLGTGFSYEAKSAACPCPTPASLPSTNPCATFACRSPCTDVHGQLLECSAALHPQHRRNNIVLMLGAR